MFWDVRVRSLETQALEPLKALEEMRGRTYSEEQAVDTAVVRLDASAEYRRLFAAAFGGERAVTAANLGRALAAFERTLTAVNAPFDRYLRGEGGAMSDSQLRGMGRFERIGCVRCHNGPMFSDYKLHVLGVPDNPALPVSDAGAGDRGTGGRYAFRTASLRNPNVGREELDPLLRRLRGVDDDDEDLIAFPEEALSDPGFDRTVPPRVPSGLPVDGRIQ